MDYHLTDSAECIICMTNQYAFVTPCTQCTNTMCVHCDACMKDNVCPFCRYVTPSNNTRSRRNEVIITTLAEYDFHSRTDTDSYEVDDDNESREIVYIVEETDEETDEDSREIDYPEDEGDNEYDEYDEFYR